MNSDNENKKIDINERYKNLINSEVTEDNVHQYIKDLLNIYLEANLRD